MIIGSDQWAIVLHDPNDGRYLIWSNELQCVLNDYRIEAYNPNSEAASTDERNRE